MPISSFCFCSLPRLNLMQFLLVSPTAIAISFASAPSQQRHVDKPHRP